MAHIKQGNFPIMNRVTEVLRRMDDNSSQPDAMKTCFGVLAIMSREDVNKLLIARDGMETIFNVMTQYVDKTDIQESGCDLIWSLAFNNNAVKDTIAKHGGSSVLVRALKRHSKSAEFLKSACGALSNMCQSRLNQEGIASQGGLQPLVGSIHIHQNNQKLLPFIFDALASLIVSNEENARTVSSLGIIPLTVSSLARHKQATDVVKSGCHALAILSDVKGQASKIAFAGGVSIILSLLDTHPSYSDLHRVAAVVILRMLQESSHVAREITCNEGVRIFLKSLDKGGAQQDTVAAVTHILFTVTNPSSPSSANIESQLWIRNNGKGSGTVGEGTGMEDGKALGTSGSKGGKGKKSEANNRNKKDGNETQLIGTAATGTAVAANIAGGGQPVSALGGLVNALGQYKERRDVVRAACRLLNNLGGFPGVITTLEKLDVLDKVLESVSIHGDTRDVIDSCAALLKAIHRRNIPIVGHNVAVVHGLIHVMNAKHMDEELVLAGFEAMQKFLETYRVCAAEFDVHRTIPDAITTITKSTLIGNKEGKSVGANGSNGDTGASVRTGGDKIWERDLLLLCIRTMDKMSGSSDVNLLSNATGNDNSSGNINSKVGNSGCAILGSNSAGVGGMKVCSKRDRDDLGGHERKIVFSKNSPRMLAALLEPIEAYYFVSKKTADINSALSMDLVDSIAVLSKYLPVRLPDVVKRMEKIVSAAAVTPRADEEKTKDNEGSTNDSGSGSEGGRRRRSGRDSGRKTPVRSGMKGNISNGGGPYGESEEYAEVHNISYPLETSSSGYVIPRVWRYESLAESDSGNQDSSANDSTNTVYRHLLPLHPNNYFVRQSGQPNHTVPRLLETWPTYLERLNTNQGGGAFARGFSAMNTTSDHRMHIVYEGNSAAGKNLMSRAATPVPYQVPVGGSGACFEHSLTFDSEFESGNLLRAVQRGDANYDLLLRADLHTAGHTQWFYFAVSNTHPQALVKLSEQGVQVPPVRVRFNIVNFTKPDSLFNLGMRPVVYSCLDAATKNAGWVRGGSDISYYSNSYSRNNTAGEGVACYYTLSFTVEFQHAKDTTLIAYSYPYTYSDYKAHLSQILNRSNASDIIRCTRLCHTLSGEDCDLLVITNFKAKDKDRIGPINLGSAESYRSDEAQRRQGGTMGRPSNASCKDSTHTLKPAVFLSCRVHPGETPASWMMKGALDFLTSDCPQAQILRQSFVVFVVPMLNPDGVIYGNNRCSLAGVDLNRQWKIPMKGLHPTVFHLKSLMAAQRRLREILCYVDLHGHSRKYNVFMYGCDEKKKSRPQVRIFPRLFSMHHIGKKYVCYGDCSFHVRKGRESTARVVVAREMNIPCSYTLEATFCGSNYGPLKHCHMHVGHLQETGAALCDTILNFSISEGKVQDALLVPVNVKATAEMETSIGEEDGVSASGQGLAIINDNRALFDSILASHIQNQQKNRIRGRIQQQEQQQYRYQRGRSAVVADAPAGGDVASVFVKRSSESINGGQSNSGYAQLRYPPGDDSTDAVRSAPGTADVVTLEHTSRPSLIRSQSGPNADVERQNHANVGVVADHSQEALAVHEVDATGLGSASEIGFLDRNASMVSGSGISGRTTPAAGGSMDVESDSDIGGASDSDSLRDTNHDGNDIGASTQGGIAAEKRVKELSVGLFRGIGGAGVSTANNMDSRVHRRSATGHAEPKLPFASSESTSGIPDAGAPGTVAQTQVQKNEDLDRRMPYVRTTLNSTMTDRLLSSDTLPSSSLALASGAGAGTGGRSSQFASEFKEVKMGKIVSGAGLGNDNGSSALKASGNRVMDDMAIKGAGSRSIGLSLVRGIPTDGSSVTALGESVRGGTIAGSISANGNYATGRSADTSVLTSPVKSAKKKKLGIKGSSSAKSRT